MITAALITRQASRDNVSAKTVERDYVLAHIISALGSLPRESNLVFKGGTALRLCYLNDFRYSADLDFSLTCGSRSDADESLAAALEVLSGSLQSVSLTETDPRKIAYVGPLDRERMLKLDISDNELVLESELCPLIRRWDDLPVNSSIRTYTPLEIAGEKLRCIIQRLQCRDLHDLHVLFEELGVNPAEAAVVFRRKAEHRDIDPATFPDKFRTRLDEYRKRWETELSEHVLGEVPHFKEIEREVSRKLRQANLM